MPCLCLYVQRLAVPRCPWRWCGESYRVRVTPSSCAVLALTSSWSRAPTTDVQTTRSATPTLPRWRTRVAIFQMLTRSWARGITYSFCMSECKKKRVYHNLEFVELEDATLYYCWTKSWDYMSVYPTCTLHYCIRSDLFV